MTNQPPQTTPFLKMVRRTAALNATSTGISALAGILLARWLGPSGRGDYAAATTYMTLTLLTFELGLSSSVVYYVSKRKSDQADLVKTAATMLVPLTIAAALVTIAVGEAVFRTPEGRHDAFAVLPLSILFSFASTPPTFALQSLALGKWNLVRISYPVTFIVLLLIARAARPLTASDAMRLMTIALAVQASVAWALYLRNFGAHGHPKKALVGPMLRYGILNMSSTTPNSINGRVDQLVLSLVVSSAILGQYAVAVSLSVLGAPIILAFGNVAFPRIARGETIQGTIRAATRGSLLISFLVVTVVVACAPFAVPIIFGPGYDSVPRLLLFLAPGAVVFPVNQVLGDLLRGLGRPGVVAIREWGGALLTTIGLIALTPRFGAIGAAVTSAATYCVVYAFLRHAVSKSDYTNRRARPNDALQPRSEEE